MLGNTLKKHFFYFTNISVSILLLIVPYYLFQGKLFLGGDDTRLFYIYPLEYLKNIAFYSWVNLSSVGWNFSYQSFVPFVAVWSLLEAVIRSKLALGYFSFSLPLVLGYIFFQKLITELLSDQGGDFRWEILLGSLFYILSPILIQNHFLNPLIPIWLIGLLPGVCYFFLKFLKTKNVLYVLFSVFYVTIFSFGAHNIPWASGFMLPTVLALFVGGFLFSKKEIAYFIKRLLFFCSVLILSQGFWLMGFVMSLLTPSSNNFTAKAISKAVVSDFAAAVHSIATGTIIYPLLNLYQRKIAFDYNWNLKSIFLHFYDKTYCINIIFVFVLFLGIIYFKKYTNLLERKIFVILLVAFTLSLYFFTVNIGPLQQVYIWLGHIPGFVLFRNPIDKFALGYTLIYALLITFSLVVLKRIYKNAPLYRLIMSLFLLVLLINAISLKWVILSPLWTTKNVYKNLVIPQEYLSFMENVKKKVSPTNNILSLPYGIAQYTVIKDTTSNNVYAGVSPVILFTGINDISGGLSFNFDSESRKVDESIMERHYEVLNTILFAHNINYVFVTKNIPEEVRKSFLFNSDVLHVQDTAFLNAITDKKILTSAYGNYELYTTKRKNALLVSKNLSFKKISNVKYELLLRNIKDKQPLIFNDTFYPGWNLFSNSFLNNFTCNNPQVFGELDTTECAPERSLFDTGDLNYIWQQGVFSSTHSVYNSFSNQWVIDPMYIKKHFNPNSYKLNQDGSIDVQMTLYYRPQGYFYVGTLISLLTILSLIFLLIKRSYEKN